MASGWKLVFINRATWRYVQLYDIAGVYIIEAAFVGDDEIGLHVGQALYDGYIKGYERGKAIIRNAVIKVACQ